MKPETRQWIEKAEELMKTDALLAGEIKEYKEKRRKTSSPSSQPVISQAATKPAL